jgi:hypothetical protein
MLEPVQGEGGVNELSKDCIKALSNICDKYNLKNIHAKGLLLAFDIPKDNGKEIVDKCLE